MPYTRPMDRHKIEPELQALRNKMSFLEKVTSHGAMAQCGMTPGVSKGDFTYIVYALAMEYVKAKGESYTNISSAISSLQDAAEEMRRRVLNPYEDKKRGENGDVK